jgi:hypothetical protein
MFDPKATASHLDSTNRVVSAAGRLLPVYPRRADRRRVADGPGADISAPSAYLAIGVALFSLAATCTTSRTPDFNGSIAEKESEHGAGDSAHVLSGYYDAFGRDSAAALAFYGEPTLIILPNDVVLLTTRADVEAFFDKFVASLKSSGYSHSKLGDHRVKLLNSTTALYSTVAICMKTDGTEMQRSGFTYVLHKSNAGWRIHEIIATDLDKLIRAD